jgi:hypothetical protein
MLSLMLQTYCVLCLGVGPLMLDVTTINFWRCKCWVSMLQTFVVRCCKHYFSMLQMLCFDVADIWCWVLCRGEGRRGSWCWMLHATRVATWPQYSRNMVATWGRREEKLLMLDVASNHVRNIFTTRSQHARNIDSVDFKSNGWRLSILGSNGREPVRC